MPGIVPPHNSSVALARHALRGLESSLQPPAHLMVAGCGDGRHCSVQELALPRPVVPPRQVSVLQVSKPLRHSYTTSVIFTVRQLAGRGMKRPEEHVAAGRSTLRRQAAHQPAYCAAHCAMAALLLSHQPA